jgi:glycine cleavage system H protein
MNVPNALRYTASHEWISLEGDVATIGITDHAQSELGDVVYVELPAMGRQVTAGEAIAVVESVKAASDIYAPLTGEVVAVNADAAADTSLLNSAPYAGGWLFRLRLADAGQIDALMDAAAYEAIAVSH